MTTSTIDTPRKIRETAIVNTLVRAYGHGSLSIRQLARVTGYPEPRVSEIVTALEASGDVRCARRGKVRLVELSEHPAMLLTRRAI